MASYWYLLTFRCLNYRMGSDLFFFFNGYKIFWYSSHWELRSMCPPLSNWAHLLLLQSIQLRGNETTWILKLVHTAWCSFLLVSWDTHAGDLSCHVRSFTILRPPCCEEAQTIRKGHLWVLQLILSAESRVQVTPVQMPDMWVKEPPDDSRPSLWVFPAEAPDMGEQRQAIPPMHCPNSQTAESV